MKQLRGYENERLSIPDSYIVVDFEATVMNKFSRHSAHEVTEIGAVMVKNGKITERFHSYVKPYVSSIHVADTKLCGITRNDILSAPDFKYAYRDFLSFCSNVKTYTWGKNDRKIIIDNIKMRHMDKYEYYIQFADAQEVFTSFLEKNNIKTLLPSVSNAIQYIGEDFEGQKHCALSDAENTAKIMMKLKEKLN